MLKEARYPNICYKEVVADIFRNGNEVSPRGLKTWEMNPYIHKITQPIKSLCSVPGRKANPFFNIAENMWILSGEGNKESTDWICSFNNKLREFQGDPGKDEFSAPYGRRIFRANRHREDVISQTPYTSMSLAKMPQVDQFFHCYGSLKKDKFSRQAVITLWNPAIDYYLNQTKDRPCNTTIYFKIRQKLDGKDVINMTVSNRSNDVHLGLYGVNFVQFSFIQMFMAACFPNLEMGHYVHFSDSLHIYENSEVTKRILESKYEFDVYEFVNPFILNHEYVKKSHDTDIGISEVMLIPLEIINENKESRNNDSKNIEKFKFCVSGFSKACAIYLNVYDQFKKKDFSKIFDQFDSLLSHCRMDDFVICGLEFMCRNKEFNEFYPKDFIESYLKNSALNLDKNAVNRVLQYLYEH